MSKIIKIEGLCCANCALKLENKLNKIKGVEAEVSILTNKIFLELDNLALLDNVIDVCHKMEPEMVLYL